MAVVVLAFILVAICDSLEADWYYLGYSVSYAIVSIIAVIFHLKTKSRLLLCYSTASLLTSILHFLVHVGFYDELKNVLWDQSINISLIIESFELILLITGGFSAAFYVYNLSVDYNNKRKNCPDRVGIT